MNILHLKSTFIVFAGLLLFSTASKAQTNLKWHLNLGTGLTDMRNFNTSFNELRYEMVGSGNNDASISFQMESKPAVLFNVGGGLSGVFGQNEMVGWDIGANIRTAGFRLKANLLESHGELDDFYKEALPEFNTIDNFRYWALHIPISLNYIPFEVIGFTIGGDLYYQFSKNPTASHPSGKLNQQMVFFPPSYKHPFQLGTHIGVFAPISQKIRLDLQFMTDISPRLSVDMTSDNLKFREMGLMINVKYSLGM